MSITNISDAVEPILQQWYRNSYEDMSYRDHPLLAHVKRENMRGEVWKIPLKLAYGAGRSASFTTAQTNRSASVRKAFLVNPGIDYKTAQVENTQIELSGDDRGAVVKLITDEVEGNHRALGDSLERDLFGTGFGTLGTIATGGISSATVTLGAREQAVNFYQGQKVVFAALETSASLRNSGAVGTVASVDLDLGKVVFTANISAIGNAIAAGDSMFQEGDKTDATPIKIVGLRGWIPLTAPTSGDSFFGVDRSTVNTTLAAGWRMDGRGMKLTEVINRLVSRISTLAGSKPDTVWMAPSQFEVFTNLLDGKFPPNEQNGRDVTLGFTGINWMSVKGKLRVMQSPFCDGDRLYVTDTSTLILGSPGNMPMKIANANGKFVDEYNADALGIRERTLGFFGCTAPGYNGVAQLNPIS